MPCMCGDYCCPSCGSAQGNSRCPLCNEWASEGCMHINSRTGNIKVKYRAAAEKRAREEAEVEAKYCAEMENMEW